MKSLGATEEQVLANIRESTHWPMEGFISPAALAHVEQAIREYLDNDRTKGVKPKKVEAELVLLANNIRSHLQHVVADAREYEVDQRIARAWAARKADDKPYAGKVFKATYDMVSGKRIRGSLGDSGPTDEELLS